MLRRALRVSSVARSLGPSGGVFGGHMDGFWSSAGLAGTPHPSEVFASGTNSAYMEEMYRLWRQDPKAVHASWDTYFRNIEAGAPPGAAFSAPPQVSGSVTGPSVAGGLGGGGGTSLELDKAVRMLHLVRSFQTHGHLAAKLDPLGRNVRTPEEISELHLSNYGLSEADFKEEVDLGSFSGIAGLLGISSQQTIGDFVSQLRSVYCGTVGYEYMHISDRERCNWLRERIEVVDPPAFSSKEKLQIFDRLCHADTLESFLASKYNTAKRFGLEGAETLIPGLKQMVDVGTNMGVSSIVIGMPHRGRLNTLVNVVRKPAEMLFREFQGTHVDMDSYIRSLGRSEDWSGSGDVKYHLGTSYDRTYEDGRRVHLSLVANPSHLEAVDPVVVGKVRAKQDRLPEDVPRNAILPVLMHGDAAFAGQGVVYETMMMAKLDKFGVEGTVHVIVNNQIGFTTDPVHSRSTKYCSDLGKAFDVPIFHVNADDPEAVTRVFALATEYRQHWGDDVIIDLIGYRRHGHNELDQPSFTQPDMYRTISKHPSALKQYRQQLLTEGSLTEEQIKEVEEATWNDFNEAFERSREDTAESTSSDWLSSYWHGFSRPNEYSKIKSTGVSRSTLEEVGRKLVTLPEGFELHRSLKRIMDVKAKALEAGEGIDWGTGEALAFGTLALEGQLIRLSGQDVERGTFSHRHAVLHDQNTGARYCPLKYLDERQAPVIIGNSFLSEYAVMGFETGYSLEAPDQLVLWEAQFGDFANGAQIIIDQFLASGETKWYRQCGLTLLLPHGYDGQGPEHSSCRVERFLQMCDDPEDIVPGNQHDEEARLQIQRSNWQIVNCSTPANYFHVLRRQQHRNFRKPLVVVAPKALLRLREAVSSFDDMAEGTKFKRVIREDEANLSVSPSKVRRHVLCTGKLYYELAKARQENPEEYGDVAITRVEQIAPFPFDKVASETERFPNATVIWAQEEPQNMGYWTYVAPRIETAMRYYSDGSDKRPVLYRGRFPAAAPAAGAHGIHLKEQEHVIHSTLGDEVPARIS